MIANVQIIRDENKPVAAVLPWSEYTRILAILEPEKQCAGIPNDVVSMVIDGDTPIRAWRKFLKFTQVEAAKKIGITQGAFAQIEKVRNSQESTLRKVAQAFGIEFEQLDMI